MRYNRVIIADRHQSMLEGIRGLLESAFETVMMVADDRSLLDAAALLDANLAVVDLSLPVSKDINIVRTLKSRFPGLRLIVLSIHDEAEAADEVLAAGAEGFVLKRAAATDLLAAIDDVLAGKTFVSQPAG